MNFGFLIRNDRCIGCHACSTACKSENEVPLGVNRTWVKSVETGAYPNVTRHFQVTRCNHCANPPCTRICPVTAMYQREDGIVEFDPDACIGCKACLQACPYDAIYLDPDSGTAAKCHFCAHRVDLQLEPACVVVCPEHAIIAGDLDDPNTEISKMLAENQVVVRKPEQGTAPKLFYVDGEEANLTPTAVPRTPVSFAWADVLPLHDGDAPSSGDGASPAMPLPTAKPPASGTPLRTPQPQGLPVDGPITIGQGRMAEQMVQVTYNAQHRVPWHWPVPAYLVTKGIGSGLFMLLCLGYLLGIVAFDAASFLIAGVTALVFTGITTGLLVLDLERPERFLRILFRPQWRSWLVRGAYLLVGFSLLSTTWLLIEFGSYFDFLANAGADMLRPWFTWASIPFALGAAIYTAFLFGQAEGRDLWQSTLLPIHLIVQAFLAGSGALLIINGIWTLPSDLASLASWTFGAALILDLLVTFAGEFGMPHASEVATKAAHDITHGRYKRLFWIGGLVVGHLAPLALLIISNALAAASAGVLALIGLYCYEHAFVMAPQDIPNS